MGKGVTLSKEELMKLDGIEVQKFEAQHDHVDN